MCKGVCLCGDTNRGATLCLCPCVCMLNVCAEGHEWVSRWIYVRVSVCEIV